MINPMDVLQAHCDQYPRRTDAASALGISVQTLTELRAGRLAFSPRMLGKLGLKRSHVIITAAGEPTETPQEP